MRFIIFCFLLLAMAGCCKVYCDGTELVVSFEKFPASDTDSVYFFSYLPSSGFTQRVDSLLITTPANPPATRSSVSHALASNYNWKVLLPSVGKEFRITNFELSTERCQCGGKRYKTIRSFTVNGERKEGLFIALE